MKGHRDSQKARAAIRQAAERVANRHSLSLKAAREWLYREAMAKRASLEQVARAVIAERALHYQYPVLSQPDRTRH